MAIGCILGNNSQSGGGTTASMSSYTCMDPMMMLGETSILCDSIATSSDRHRYTYLVYTDDYIFMMRTDSNSSSKPGLFKIVRMDNGAILANDVKYTSQTVSVTPYCGAYTIGNAVIMFGCHSDGVASSNTIKIFEINKDDDTYTETDYACPRYLNSASAIIRQGNSFYLLGVDDNKAATYKDIVRFDYGSKSFTVLGQTVTNLTFNQVNTGIFWGDDQLIVHGKRIDDNIETIVLWTPATGYFEDVTNNADYAYVLAFFDASFFGYGESRVVANIQYLNGLYIKTKDGLFNRTTNSSYSVNFKDNYIAAHKGICLDAVNKITFTFTFPMTVFGDRSVGRYSIFVIKNDLYAIHSNGYSGEYTLGELQALGKTKINQNFLRGVGIDVVKLNKIKPKKRTIDVDYTEKVFYVPAGKSIKIASDYPEYIFINFMRDGDFKKLDLTPDDTGFYEIPQPCYVYAGMACPYIRMTGASTWDMYNWFINPFAILSK